MLSNAKTKLAQGVDVVAGIVETHGREETRALLQGIPHVPLRTFTHRGRSLPEFDLDALLERRPQLALIDELAHSNAPGARHAKRYQDVQELLDAGIDVYSTLNVQHLESYNDLVTRITGVEIRETVPDAVLDLAADIELIDLAPDDLIERLRQGKVYIPEQAHRALDNYFSRGNLLALRELALRAAAERVDDDLSTFMRAHAIDGPWPARGRLLACVDDTPSGEALLRAAKRLADQRHLPWTALHVQAMGRPLSETARRQLESNLTLATQLDGETASIVANRVGAGVLEYARARNVAQIIVGRPHAARPMRWWHGSLAQWLFRHATEYEITVVGGDAAERAAAVPASFPAPLRSLGMRSLSFSVGISAAATLIAALIDRWIDVDDLSAVFLLGVAVVGGLAGLWPALFASALSFLAYNFFFTEPRMTLLVADPSDLRALIGFLIVAVGVGVLAGRLKRQAADATRHALRTETLFDFARRLATAINELDLRRAAASGIAEILQRRCFVLEADAQGRASIPLELSHKFSFRDTDQAAADWALAHLEAAGAGTKTLPAAGWHFLPVSAGKLPLGVIAMELPGSVESLSSEDRRLLISLQSQLATAWERFRLRRHAEDAKLQRAAEGLRSALLASVSHDLRTPLVSVIGSLTAIRDLTDKIPPPDHARLIETALSEAERLNRLIQNLLDAARLAQGGVSPRLTEVSVAETIRLAVSRMSVALRQRIDVEAAETLPPLRADRTLLEQSLMNLLENAGKYSPDESRIDVTAEQRGGDLVIRISDQGPGIAAADRAKVFDLFFRAARHDSGVSGSGLGLAICKGFIEAMGGRISARAGAEGRGAVFEIEFPIGVANRHTPDSAADAPSGTGPS